MSKVNLYINTKHYTQNKNPNNIVINIPAGSIKCNPKTQYIEMNIVSWIMKNDFYNTQASNNKFEIIKKDLEDVVISSQEFQIKPGNYNVYSMKDELNKLLNGLVIVSYNNTLNTYTYTRSDENANEKLYIKSITANDFLGYDNNIETLLDNSSSSVNVLNMAGDELIVLELQNVNTKQPIYDNLFTYGGGNVVSSKVIAFLSIDQPSYHLLQYTNDDGGDSFSYIINESEVNELHLTIKNQDKEIIDVSDYFLSLQFIIQEKHSSTMILVLKSIDSTLKQILMMFGDLWKIYSKK
jgi:hypothetical protein